MKNWNEVNLTDIFQAKAEGPYGEIKFYPRKYCPVCNAPLKKLSFEGEEKNLLETDKPVEILDKPYLRNLEVMCPNCGHRIVKA